MFEYNTFHHYDATVVRLYDAFFVAPKVTSTFDRLTLICRGTQAYRQLVNY